MITEIQFNQFWNLGILNMPVGSSYSQFSGEYLNKEGNLEVINT